MAPHEFAAVHGPYIKDRILLDARILTVDTYKDREEGVRGWECL